MQTQPRADDGDQGRSRTQAASTDGGPAEPGPEVQALDPDVKAVLEDLESIDVNTTPPIELVSTVQKLQERLEETDR